VHAVRHQEQTRLLIANAIDFDQALETDAHHAESRASRSINGVLAKERHRLTEQHGCKIFTVFSRARFTIDVYVDCHDVSSSKNIVPEFDYD
jgi:hypothetical protein